MQLYQDYEFCRVYVSLSGKYFIVYKDGKIWDCSDKRQMFRIINKKKKELEKENPECLGTLG